MRTTSRLCIVHGQYRTPAGRVGPVAISRRGHRPGRRHERAILEIEVRGKRGTGYCKSMPGAVLPFERLRNRLLPRRRARKRPSLVPDDRRLRRSKVEKPKPTDLLFDMTHRELFKQVLQEEELQFDREGQRRTAYSLRHTYICLRLMEGADIYQIAKNCRTSVEMIEKYYASHIKTSLDAAAINVRKSRMAPLMKDRPKRKEPPKGRGRNA